MFYVTLGLFYKGKYKMSFDCKYKAKDYQCIRLKIECSPGIKGCVLNGRYVFPFKEEKTKDKKTLKKKKN